MTVRRLYPICCLLFLADSACAEKRELGVDVFSDDTMPARFTVAMTGTLVLGLRSQNFFVRPDKSLVLITPGESRMARADLAGAKPRGGPCGR